MEEQALYSRLLYLRHLASERLSPPIRDLVLPIRCFRSEIHSDKLQLAPSCRPGTVNVEPDNVIIALRQFPDFYRVTETIGHGPG